MKNLIQRLMRALLGSVPVSNEAETIAVSNATGPSAGDGDVLALNAEGRLIMRVPYGDFPAVNDRGQRVVQRLDEEAVETMAGVFSNADGIVSKVKSLIRGGWHRRAAVPLYKGHPDDPRSTEHDESAMGWLHSIAASNGEMVMEFEPTEDGLELVKRKKFRFYSPRWDTAPTSNKGVVRPWMMLSVGLTNRHNIPVSALSNDDAGDERPTEPVSNCCGCAVSAEQRRTVAQRLCLAEGATHDEIVAALDVRAAEVAQRQAEVKAMRDQLAAEQSARASAELAATAANSVIAERDAALSEAVSNRDEAHAARVDSELRRLQLQGRLTPARYKEELPACTALSNSDFTARLAELDAEPAPERSGRVTDGAASNREQMSASAISNGADTRAKARSNFIGQVMAQPDLKHLSTDQRRTLAWAELAKQHPELID